MKKKKNILKKSVFQDPDFIRSLYKVVDALGFQYITFFTLHQNHPRVILF